MNRILITLLAGTAVALSGCATLSREECSSGDWRKIGLQDGSDGYTPDRFDRHASACSLDRSEASRTAYLEGRQEGLKSYCTMVRGYREGALAQKYHGVCPADSENRFLTGYNLGQRILQAESRSSDITDALREVEEKLHEESLTASQRTELLAKKTELEAADARAREEIKALRAKGDELVASARRNN